MHTDGTAGAAIDLDDVLAITNRDASPVAFETKSRQPAAPATHATADLVASLDRQTAAITSLAKSRTAAPAALPAAARSPIEKARAMRELRQTSEAAQRRPDVVLAEKQARINAAMDGKDAADTAAIRAENQRLAREVADLRRKAARPPGPRQMGGGMSEKSAVFATYRKAMTNYLRTGQETFAGRHLKELQAACVTLDAKAFNATVNAEGGYFVQPEHDTGPLERLLNSLSPMRQLATVRNISSASFKSRVNMRGQNFRWVGEQTPTTTDTTPSFAELEFPAATLLSEPEVTQEALEDAAIDVEQLLSEEAQYEFAEGESIAFIGGNGVNKPKGILGYTFVADASWAWNSVGYLATGADGAFHSTDPADVIVRLPLQLKAQFRNSASWLINRSTIGQVRTIKDAEKRYIWGEGDVSKQIPSSLAGYTVHEDEQMPAIGSGAHALAFGDWARAYIIVDRLGFQAFRNPYINPPYVRFHLRKRVGGGVKRFDAYKTIKFSAS